MPETYLFDCHEYENFKPPYITSPHRVSEYPY